MSLLLSLSLSLCFAETAAAADDGSGCEDALLGEWACERLNDIPGVNSVYEYLGDVHRDKVEQVTGSLDDIVPENFIEEWVTGMAESTVTLLAYIQELGERVTTPAFDQRWWASQYASSFGLSLILLTLLLVWLTAQCAAAGASASGVDLLRQSGWRLVFVVPLISAGPVVLLELQLMANELARVFADEGTAHAGSAVEQLMQLIVDTAGDWGVFGGSVLALILFLAILCLGVVTLIEMAIAQWGLHLGALLVPLVLVAWVYPPWSAALRRLAGLLGGLMLLPAFIYFFFNTLWTAFDGLMRDRPEDDGLAILLFLLVGLFMIDSFPAVAMWLMSMGASGATGMDPQVRGAVDHPSGGEMMAGVTDRFEARMSRLGSSKSSGGGGSSPDGGSADDDQDDQPDADGASSQGGHGAVDSAQTAAAAGASGGATATAAATHEATEHDGDDAPDTPGPSGGDPGTSSSTGPEPPPARQPEADDGPEPAEQQEDNS
ncbi:hypothetical protein [Streptomyces hainanensis]|uniref:Type IV secretion system protein n=1 Tax=Streptomyces hainanensis TaxID=402648 RepID=A0A4R4TQT9_9ACTN|nr:hypothetical protein [Streptomyces hainanensis]TDC76479.1 hypothetical protein E1283_09780 [Streptomyces hainanensis]